MEQQHFDQLQETLFHEKLENGLDVYILPKEGFNKTFATFTTKYGSIDNHFSPIGTEELVKVPDGIAHFLEHKMFEKPDGSDVFQDFGKQGAQANAFTTYTRTAYLFSSTSEVEKNLETLIDFVQTPAWTEQSVEKEKGIIGQEIRMYDDNPDWRVYSGLISNMYKEHPVHIDIAGTVESISHITKDTLMDCYKTFYHPSNMLLFVVGPVKPEKILKLVQENQSAKGYTDQPPIKRKQPDEPESVAKSHSVIHMAVETPKLLVGYKEKTTGRQGEELLKHELIMKILLEMMFGQSSEYYETLFNEGLIDESFSFEYNEEESYGFSALGGNTDQPDELANRIQEMIKAYQQKTFDQQMFERIRKKKIGSFLKALNSPEYIATQFTRYQFNQMNLFDNLTALETLQPDDVETVLREHFNDAAFTQCQVRKR